MFNRLAPSLRRCPIDFSDPFQEWIVTTQQLFFFSLCFIPPLFEDCFLIVLTPAFCLRRSSVSFITKATMSSTTNNTNTNSSAGAGAQALDPIDAYNEEIRRSVEELLVETMVRRHEAEMARHEEEGAQLLARHRRESEFQTQQADQLFEKLRMPDKLMEKLRMRQDHDEVK